MKSTKSGKSAFVAEPEDPEIQQAQARYRAEKDRSDLAKVARMTDIP